MQTIFCLCAGLTVGSYGELTARAEQRAPHTPAPLESVKKIYAELCSEPIPAGKDYYRITARLLTCTTADDGVYATHGNIRLMLPLALVRATYAGGVTRIGTLPDTASNAKNNRRRKRETAAERYMQHCVFHNDRTAFDTDQKPQICRFYVRGLQLSVHGRFNKDGTVFYARSEPPLFFGWRSSFDRIRAFFRFYFIRLLYEWGEAGGLILALLAADKAFLSPQCIEAFRNAGLAHILALSGMHLSLIGTAALQGGRIFGHKKRAFQFSFAAVCLFVWFAGSAPSLNRALGMFIITIAGNLIGIRPHLFSVLCAMLTVHIAFLSTEALSLGFMLSYGACAGIIIFGKACAQLAAGKIPPDIVQSLSASIGAQLFTAPIVITGLGSIATVGIVASCIVSPLVSLFLIAALICIPLAVLLPFLSPIIGSVINLLYALIFHTAEFFSRFPVISSKTVLECILYSFTAFCIGSIITGAAWIQQKRETHMIHTSQLQW